MGKISVNNIKIRANHGCWEEEEKIGGDYIVDVAIDINFKDAAANDDLSKTIDYVVVSDVVHREMAIRAKLIETVCARIHSAVKLAFHRDSKVWVRITKLSAPIPGQVESVSVEMNE